MIDVPRESAESGRPQDMQGDLSLLSDLDNVHLGQDPQILRKIQYKSVEATVLEVLRKVGISPIHLQVDERQSVEDFFRELVMDVIRRLKVMVKQQKGTNSLLEDLLGNTEAVASVAKEEIRKRIQLKGQSVGVRYEASGVVSYDLSPARTA